MNGSMPDMFNNSLFLRQTFLIEHDRGFGPFMEVVLPSSSQEEVPKVSKKHEYMQKTPKQISQAEGMLMENYGTTYNIKKPRISYTRTTEIHM